MARQLILAFDVVNRRLVRNYQGSANALEFGQTTYSTRIYFVQPSADSIPGLPAYEAFDSTSYGGIRAGLWSDSTGTLDDSSEYVLALAPDTAWTYNDDDADYPYYEGEITFYTEQVAEFLGSSKTADAYFAVSLMAGTTLYTVFDHVGGAKNAKIFSTTDEGGGVPIDVTQIDALAGGQLLSFLREQNIFSWREMGLQENQYLLGHCKRTYDCLILGADARGISGIGADTILSLAVDGVLTGDTMTFSVGSIGAEVTATFAPSSPITLTGGTTFRWIVTQTPVGADAMVDVCVNTRIAPTSILTSVEDGNWRFKDGLIQFWSPYYYDLDSGSPWYTLVDGETGPTRSDPIPT